MKLLQYELKKLLYNKRSFFFILSLALFYIGIGMGHGLFTFKEDASFTEYSQLAKEVAGPKQDKFAKDATTKMNELFSVLGSSHQVMKTSSKDSLTKLYFNYYQYLARVDAYYNGAETDDTDEYTGILPLKKKVEELASEGKTDTYQYKKLKKQLDTQTELGAPEFDNVVLWENLYEGWNGILILILLFFPLAFLISPVFTKEVSTGMDNIILSSANGRTSIVLAKLGAVSVTSMLLSIIYFASTFLGNFLPFMSIEGSSSHVRSLSFMAGSSLDMSIFSFALLTVLWVTMAALVFGIIITLLSSLLKNHAAVFGIGIIVLLFGMILESLGTEIVQQIQLFIDYCFKNTISISTIFGSFTYYNIFGFAIPYWLCSIIVFLALSVSGFVALLYQQKRRTIA